MHVLVLRRFGLDYIGMCLLSLNLLELLKLLLAQIMWRLCYSCRLVRHELGLWVAIRGVHTLMSNHLCLLKIDELLLTLSIRSILPTFRKPFLHYQPAFLTSFKWIAWIIIRVRCRAYQRLTILASHDTLGILLSHTFYMLLTADSNHTVLLAESWLATLYFAVFNGGDICGVRSSVVLRRGPRYFLFIYVCLESIQILLLSHLGLGWLLSSCWDLV